MNVFLSQLGELAQQSYIQILLAFFVAVQALWWLHVFIARKNRRIYSDTFTGNYAVIIGVGKANPDLFESCLKSITAHSNPAELIVVVDDAPRAARRIKNLAKKYATKYIELPQLLGTREQYAHAAEALKKKVDVVIVVQPDTVWQEETILLLDAFTDDRVGAVGAYGRVRSPERTLTSRAGDMVARLHNQVTLLFESYFGDVVSLPAYTFAARREIFKKAALAARRETFLGRRMFTGFEGSFTTHVRAQGYRVVHSPAATVEIITPRTPAAFLRHQVRAYRTALRQFFHDRRIIVRHHVFVTFSRIVSLFFGFLYAALLATLAFMLIFGVYGFHTSIDSASVWWLMLALGGGYVVLAYLRALAYVPVRSRTFAVAPLLMAYSDVVGLTAHLVAAFTYAENSSAARVPSAYGEGKVGRTRVVAALTGLVLLAVAAPLAYFATIHPQGVPLDIIVDQRGETYVQAQDLANRQSDPDTRNNPTDAEIAVLLRQNSTHYGEPANDTLIAQAIPCAREVLNRAPQDEAPLNELQGCYADALAAAESAQRQAATPPPAPTQVTMTTQKGDTLTHLVRGVVRQKDTTHTLTASHAVFIETTYLSQKGQLNHYLDIGEEVTVDTVALDTLIAQAKQLPAEQLALWDCYAANIVW